MRGATQTDQHSALGAGGFAHMGLSHTVQMWWLVTEQSHPNGPTACSQPSAFEVLVSSVDWLCFEDPFAMQDRYDLHLSL